MPQKKTRYSSLLAKKYIPSEPCDCKICRGYCKRPGWWTVEEAGRAVKAGLAGRMMLEISQDLSFGVLAPAFKGCEQAFAKEPFVHNGCTFLSNGRCELFGTGHQPLECRFCHHGRRGRGLQCHVDIGKEWNSLEGRRLVVQWTAMTEFWKRLAVFKKNQG